MFCDIIHASTQRDLHLQYALPYFDWRNASWCNYTCMPKAVPNFKRFQKTVFHGQSFCVMYSCSGLSSEGYICAVFFCCWWWWWFISSGLLSGCCLQSITPNIGQMHPWNFLSLNTDSGQMYPHFAWTAIYCDPCTIWDLELWCPIVIDFPSKSHSKFPCRS